MNLIRIIPAKGNRSTAADVKGDYQGAFTTSILKRTSSCFDTLETEDKMAITFSTRRVQRKPLWRVLPSFLAALWLSVAIPSGISSAQTLRGRVIDAKTGESLQGASVRLLLIHPERETEPEFLTGAITGADGLFRLQIDTPVVSGASVATQIPPPATQTSPSAASQTDSNRTLATRPIKTLLEIRHIGYTIWTRNLESIIQSGAEQPLLIRLEPDPFEFGEVFVNATRADASTPLTYITLDRDEIVKVNQGRDIPFIVAQTPSVLATSDAGTGIGYTGIRIRGVDPTRINVTLNGIPLNDAESQGVFWVNLPDLASSTQSIQIQRGVGTSTHGAGAFGATMNLQTGLLKSEPTASFHSTIGAFQTRKASLFVGSGLLDGGWMVEGRLATIQSEGYIDRASADLNSFHVTASQRGERSLLKFDVLSGKEITYQAWNGVPEPLYRGDADGLEHYISTLWIDAEAAAHLRENLGNRRFNEFTYDGQVDNYRQDHIQAHYSLQASPQWQFSASAHYTYGRGYYEEFKSDQSLQEYSIAQVELANGAGFVSESDLIRRRWLRNHYYGGIATLEGRLGAGSGSRSAMGITGDDRATRLTLGLAFHTYDGDHFGQVIWAPVDASELRLRTPHRYYFNNGKKTDASGYIKLIHPINSAIHLYGDLQLRSVGYTFLGKRRIDQPDGSLAVQDVEQEEMLAFFNPKTGLVWMPSDLDRIYLSLAVGSKEPGRDEYVDSTPESRPSPEYLYNLETGWERRGSRTAFSANFYAMIYRDQLILTGEVNDVGEYVRKNVSRSRRIGLELAADLRLLQNVEWSGSLTLSQNRIPLFTSYMDDYDTGVQSVTEYQNTPIAFSPSLIGKSGLAALAGPARFSLTSQVVSRQFLDNTGTKTRSLDPFAQHDLTVESDMPERFRFGSRRMVWAASVINVFDADIVSNGYTFGFISGGQTDYFTYLYPQAGRHILVEFRLDF